jgi:hypothetical protein
MSEWSASIATISLFLYRLKLRARRIRLNLVSFKLKEQKVKIVLKKEQNMYIVSSSRVDRFCNLL